MISLYRDGTSPLHRAPAGAKLVVLALTALTVSLLPREPLGPALALLGGSVLLVIAGYAAAGLAGLPLVRQLWSTRWIVLLMVTTQLLFLGPAPAAVNSTRVVVILLLAALLTLTTRSEDLLAALQSAMRPLARVGVDPRRVALTLSLAIAMVPVVGSIAARVREAQRARGVRVGFRAVVPLLVLSLRHADDVADAMTARGVD